MVTLRFLGSGDAFGSGGRFNTCFLVKAEAAAPFLIDCGATSLVAMHRFGVDASTIGMILVSHLHGDHFGGLPFFLLQAQHVHKRTAPLTIAGPPGLKARLRRAFKVLYPGAGDTNWRFDLRVVPLAPGRRRDLDGGITVCPYEVLHPSGAPSFALRVETGGRSLCYSGDTAWTEALIEAARGVDLFITETYSFRRPVPYHIDLPTLRRHLPKIGAKRVILTHLGPDMLANADSLDLDVAHDGLIVEI